MYTLKENQLNITYEVKNRSTPKEMYYGIGGHPAFNVSQTLDEEENLELDHVRFHFEPSGEQLFIPLSKEGLLQLRKAKHQTVSTTSLTHISFENDAFVYKVKPATAIVLTDEANRVEVRVDLKQMRYVGIWSPYPRRAGFVCLDPWAAWQMMKRLPEN